MKRLAAYYLFIIIFYLIEITIFRFFIVDILHSTNLDQIYFLNALIRLSIVGVSTLALKNLLYSSTKHFYLKFIPLIIINPTLSTFFLYAFINLIELEFNIIFLKFISDLIVSIMLFLILERIK